MEQGSGHGVFCLISSLSLSVSLTHSHSHTRTHWAPEVLIIQGWPLDNPILKLRWDNIRRPVPFWTRSILQRVWQNKRGGGRVLYIDSLGYRSSLSFTNWPAHFWKKWLHHSKVTMGCHIIIILVSGLKFKLSVPYLKPALKWCLDSILMHDKY